MSNQRREGRQRIVLRPNVHTVLCGFSPDFGVYAAWEPRRHSEFAYSRNVQVREPLLEEAQATGWAVAHPRRVRGGLEVRVAFTPGNIARFIQLSRLADLRGLDGEEREAFFLSYGAWAPGAAPVPEEVQQIRTRILVSRLQRDPAFRGKINAAFNSTCAVCGVQLKIVHAAHIRPVDEEGSTDDVWNGFSSFTSFRVDVLALLAVARRKWVVTGPNRVGVPDPAVPVLDRKLAAAHVAEDVASSIDCLTLG